MHLKTVLIYKEPCEVKISCTVLKSKNTLNVFLRLTTRLLTE